MGAFVPLYTMKHYEIEFIYQDKKSWMYCVEPTKAKAKTYFNRQVKENGYTEKPKAKLLEIREMKL